MKMGKSYRSERGFDRPKTTKPTVKQKNQKSAEYSTIDDDDFDYRSDEYKPDNDEEFTVNRRTSCS